MKRLLATIRCDLALQWRNGFFFAAAFVVVVWGLLANQMGAAQHLVARLQWLIPAMLLNELVIVTFFFVGGLMLLEKGEGTIQAQIVSPLHMAEYVMSKIVTLTVAAVAQVLVIVALIPGIDLRWLPLIAGVMLAAIMFVLAGIIVVMRARSINEYLLPSIMYLGLLLAPMLPYAIGWNFWLMYLHPVQAPLVLMRAAMEDMALWQIVYGVAASSCWIVLLYRISVQQFQRFVVAAV